ncbi:MAG TPA: serine hydrolase domain-containing protein, partial [Anaerolineaceae bacterium]
MPDFPSTELDSYILNAMRVFDTPGLSLSVIQNDRVLCARGYGARKLGGDPVNEHTSFAIGSISKSFTSTALGMLVDEGRLGWDDPVRDYLPGFQMMDPFANLE